ncbi:MAG: hypothetical protein IE925_13175 [Rhodobacterales bacterium]|nr:hypothetical protein [Rhodobacterales bacterium]
MTLDEIQSRMTEIGNELGRLCQAFKVAATPEIEPDMQQQINERMGQIMEEMSALIEKMQKIRNA